ncbi:MAG: HAD family hydrolase, partial [Ilumatobacteraceae bacterium]
MSVRFDAILFDAGGIFVMPDPVTIGVVIRQCGGDSSVEKLIRAHYAGMAGMDSRAQHSQGTSIDAFSWDSYREAYVDAAGVPEGQREVAVVKLRDLFSPFLWRFPLLGSTAALWRLHLKNVPIGVVSNASGQIEQTLANQCVCQVGPGAGVPVLIVTDSHVIGVAKPDPGVFADAIALMERRGISKERIAYVGDSFVNDVGGALNAGLVPLLLDPYDDHVDDGCERIHSLHEL